MIFKRRKRHISILEETKYICSVCGVEFNGLEGGIHKNLESNDCLCADCYWGALIFSARKNKEEREIKKKQLK